MTTLTYAFIDQAWDGGAPGKASKQSRSSKSMNATARDPACALYKRRKGAPQSYNKNYDDVIDTYLNDGATGSAKCASSIDDVAPTSDVGLGMFGRSIIPGEDEFNDVSFYKPNNTSTQSGNRCNTQPVPLNSDTVDAQLDYDRFFHDDQLFDAPVRSHRNAHSVPEEEQRDDMIIQEEGLFDVYGEQPTNDHQYVLAPQQTVAPAPWLEILLFVASGILLIFILEQVLQMGIYLR